MAYLFVLSNSSVLNVSLEILLFIIIGGCLIIVGRGLIWVWCRVTYCLIFLMYINFLRFRSKAMQRESVVTMSAYIPISSASCYNSYKIFSSLCIFVLRLDFRTNPSSRFAQLFLFQTARRSRLRLKSQQFRTPHNRQNLIWLHQMRLASLFWSIGLVCQTAKIYSQAR